MFFVITVIAILSIIFFGALLIINSLKHAKLQSSLKKSVAVGSKEDAADTLMKLIRRDPFDIEKRKQAAILFMDIGNYSEAAVQLNSILVYGRGKQKVNEKEINRSLAKCHLQLGNLDEALKAYAVILKIDPDDVTSYIELGRIERQKKALLNATKYYKKAHSLEPDNFDILKELGTLFFQLNKHSEALTVLEHASEIKPDDSEVHYYLGELHNFLEDHNEALKHYIRARWDPKFSYQSLLAAGKILRKYQKYDDALRVLLLALKTEGLERDTMLDIRYEIGEVSLAKGDILHAIEQWEKILSNVSDYRDVPAKLEKYEQTRSNFALRAYMMATQSDFQKLCRRIVRSLTNEVSIIRTENCRDSTVEIFAQAVYRNMNTTILFKFFRGTSKIGEFAIREFYEKLKEMNAKLGICLTNTDYTEEAQAFGEGRVLELISDREFLSTLTKAVK